MNTNIQSILKTQFGFDAFRDKQEEVIQTILRKEPAVVLMPTGGGKSLCYQLPALCQEGITIVISPLIALMKDQVDSLSANGIKAAAINSQNSPQENDLIIQLAIEGQIRLLYLAPERLANRNFLAILQELPVSLIAIDEAHCISEWGHDFRPEYRNLHLLNLQFPKATIIALTATATPQVLSDIQSQLRLTQAKCFVSSFNRKNLTYVVEDKQIAFRRLLKYLDKYKGESVIIYRFSRKNTEELAADLKNEGFSALPYHAGLDQNVRQRTQEKFIRDEIQIIVATIAFGMGIDKSNIRLVVHYDLPKSVEGYYQETGRAGRDGLASDCVLFYGAGDASKQRYFINQKEDPAERSRAEQQLQQMVDYAELAHCRRSYLLRYFGEQWPNDPCGGCDFCLTPKEFVDVSSIARTILATLKEMNNPFGLGHVGHILIGSRRKEILACGHEKLSGYGKLAEQSREQIRYYLKTLIQQGLLAQSTGSYPTLSITPRGIAFLTTNEPLSIIKPPEHVASINSRSRDMGECDQALFELLRKLRKQIADGKQVPAFTIFHDSSLVEMANYYPQSLDAFYNITGVGKEKREQFGQAFVELIKEYAQKNKLQEKPIKKSMTKPSSRKKEKLLSEDSTYQKTRQLIERGLSIIQAAQERSISPATVLNHLEELKQSGISMKLDHLKPDEYSFNKIKIVFDELDTFALKPVFVGLGEKVPYDEIRLVRLFL